MFEPGHSGSTRATVDITTHKGGSVGLGDATRRVAIGRSIVDNNDLGRFLIALSAHPSHSERGETPIEAVRIVTNRHHHRDIEVGHRGGVDAWMSHAGVEKSAGQTSAGCRLVERLTIVPLVDRIGTGVGEPENPQRSAAHEDAPAVDPPDQWIQPQEESSGGQDRRLVWLVWLVRLVWLASLGGRRHKRDRSAATAYCSG